VTFGAVILSIGIVSTSASLFFSLTDLRKSQFTGLYKSSLAYSVSDLERIYKDELLLTDSPDPIIQPLPVDTYSTQITKFAERLDEKLNTTLKFGRRQSLRFYRDFNASGFTTQIELFMNFQPVPTSRDTFVFKGFGIIEDRHQTGLVARCALVVPETPMSANHNIFKIRGVRDRLELMTKGRLVSVEIHQLIDPFNKFPDYLILLKFRIKRRIVGWQISEGLYFVWDTSAARFLPSGCTANLSIER
jgi:hypothetical protein